MALAWPTDLRPSLFELFLQHKTTIHVSPITGSQQVLRRQGEAWRLHMNIGPTAKAKAQRIDALLAKLKGAYETVNLWDFDREEPAGTNRDRDDIAETYFADVGPPTQTDFTDGTQFDGGDGTVTVWGGWAVGSESILTDGWYPSETVLKAGDYIGIGGKLYLVTDDVNSTAIGRATLSIAPRLKIAAAHLDVVTRTRPTAEMRLVDDGQPNRSVDPDGRYQFSLAFMEAQ